MKRVAEALGVSRSNLAEKKQRKPRGPHAKPGDAELLLRIRAIVDARGSYGYRRVTALLNREGKPPVNFKRVYRVSVAVPSTGEAAKKAPHVLAT
ncbi:MAG: transposase [Deltaproteobacteria bacterium]|nr:transposase [Deltaproteobacteria bacterium]